MILEAVLENISGTFNNPIGALRYPYLDPGGVYAKNLWDWDSLWTFKALLGIADKIDKQDLKRDVLMHGIGSVKNFFDHQADDGSIPILLTDTDTDPFESCKSAKNNMAKPVFGQFCETISEYSDELAERKSWISSLDKFYACYDKRYKHAESGLYCWANDIAIGVDDDPATWGRPSFSSANIYLNCFLCADLKAAANFAEKFGYLNYADEWRNKSDQLADSIQEFCWDERDGMFYSVDVQCHQNLCDNQYFGKLNINAKPFWNVLMLKVMSWCSFLPMWCSIATKDQAERMVNQHLINRERFWSDWGIRSLSADEKMYSPSAARGNPSNWLGPVWVVSNYMIWDGLQKYGYNDYARKISANIQNLLLLDFKRNGFMHENYNPDTGESISAPNFWNWNLLACIMK